MGVPRISSLGDNRQFALDRGADIAVSAKAGVIAVSPDDGLAQQSPSFFDLDGSFLGNDTFFDSHGLGVQSLDFDQTTGDLYLLATFGSNRGTNPGLWRRSPDGTYIHLGDNRQFALDRDADIAAFSSPVPEPSALVLALFELLCFAGISVRQRRIRGSSG